MKLSSIPGIINEKKIIENTEKYNKGKKLGERYLYDSEFVIKIIDVLTSKDVLVIVDKSNREIWSADIECYTPVFAMFIWREIALPAIGIDYATYEAMDILNKLK